MAHEVNTEGKKTCKWEIFAGTGKILLSQDLKVKRSKKVRNDNVGTVLMLL